MTPYLLSHVVGLSSYPHSIDAWGLAHTPGNIEEALAIRDQVDTLNRKLIGAAGARRLCGFDAGADKAADATITWLISKGMELDEARGLEVSAAIERLAQSNQAPPATPAAPTTRKGKKNINARMLETITENSDSIGWNCTQWAKHLKCSTSAVTKKPAWRDLELRRELQKAERARDRRRKPKASDRRRS